MLYIRDIRLRDLEAFTGSGEFHRMEHIPISPRRAIAHAHNPRASSEDKVLFLAYEEDRFIGYLGAVPDLFFCDGKSHKLAWLSCMWVDPQWRRHGIAYKLLEHAHAAWQSRLLISNFIPRSKAVFDKTRLFEQFKSLEGIRGYLRFNLTEILITKKPALQKLSGILSMADGILNGFNEIRLSLRAKAIVTVAPDFLQAFTSDTEAFLSSHNQHHLSLKNIREFRWMMDYPWVTETSRPDRDAMRYDFTSVAKRFRQYFLHFHAGPKQPVAFVVLLLRNNNLKTSFAHIASGYEKDILHFIYQFMIRNAVRTFTTYHPGLVSRIKSDRNPFIRTRRMILESIITPRLKEELGNTDAYYLQEGDGDGAFT